MGFFINLGSLLSGKGGTYHGSVRSKPFQELLDTTTNEENYLGNWARQISGSALTDAEREANSFNAQQAQLAFDRQMAARSTAFQTQVRDMKAAGLNPMLAASGSGSVVPSAGGASSVSPGSSPLNLGSLLSAVSGLQVNSAQAALMRAEAEKARADTDKVRSETDYFNSVKSIRAEAEKRSLNLTDAQIHEIDAKIKKLHSSAENDVQQAMLANVNARNIEYMQSFMAGYYDSLSKANDARAELDLIDAAYKQRLIDSGSIEAAVRLTMAEASKSEQDSVISTIEAGLKAKEFNEKPDSNSNNPVERVLGQLGRDVKIILGKI